MTDIANTKLSPKNLEIGSAVQVIIPGTGGFKYMGALLGADRERSLMVSLPGQQVLQRQGVRLDDVLFTGQTIECRTVINGVIVVFKSKILSVYNSPVRMLVASYPDSVNKRSLRKDTRFPCTLPVNLNGEAEGVLVNVSQGGGQMYVAKGPITDLLSIYKNDQVAFPLTIDLPYQDNPAELKVQIKSLSDEGGRCSYGFAFEGDNALILEYIKALQLEDFSNILMSS